MNTRPSLTSLLIFPVAPIAVIFFSHLMCREIWYANYYVPGEDGGEVEPALALIGIPLFLIIVSLLLGGLTILNRWAIPRWLTALVRVPIASRALLLSLAATMFFMGDALAVLSHWQVATAWLAWFGSAVLFVMHQWDRLQRWICVSGQNTPSAPWIESQVGLFARRIPRCWSDQRQKRPQKSRP